MDGRTNVSEILNPNALPLSTFQGREYSIWATNRWKMLPGKRIRKGWFDRTAHAPFHTTRTPDNKRCSSTDTILMLSSSLWYRQTHRHAIIILLFLQTLRHINDSSCYHHWFTRCRLTHAPFHTTRTPDNKTDAMLFDGHNPHAMSVGRKIDSKSQKMLHV
jgi:hypothetical protein